MRPDIGRLHIEKIIVHDLPKRYRGVDEQPQLSEVESTIDADLRTFFQERIKLSLAKAAFDVVLDPDADSPTPGLIFDQLGTRARAFVEMSRELATRLHASQTGVNSAGILAVIQGEIGGSPCLGVLKLERDTGVRLEAASLGGLATFSIHQVKDLMMTKKTKVFKACIFVQNGADFDTVAGLMSDNQRGQSPRSVVAEFFLREFLGCRLREAPEVTTQRFFVEAQEFIGKHVLDAERKASSLMALLATLSSNDITISPIRFAESYLIGPDRQAFLDHLEQAGVPTVHIEKDTSLITRQLGRAHYDFESGLVLYGPADSFDRHVTVINSDDGGSRTEIADNLKDVHAR